MSNEIIIRMPYLHPGLNDESNNLAERYFTNLKFFWPGHAALETSSPYWQAENMPLSIAEAASILDSLHFTDLQDLERIRLLMQQRIHEDNKRFHLEMAALQNFLASPENMSEKYALDAPLKQAQINLLWLWLQEEEYLEIDSLTRKCADSEAKLLTAVHDKYESPIYKSFTDLETARELLPDWKKTFQNAAFFINSELPILIEGAMEEDLLSEFSFENIDTKGNDFMLKKIQLPLWQILGQEKDKFPSLQNYWLKPRTLYALISS